MEFIQFWLNVLFFSWLSILTAVCFCHQRMFELAKEIMELIADKVGIKLKK